MKVTLTIPDSAYEALTSGQQRRVRGSVALVSKDELTLNVYQRTPSERRSYRRLPHGRVSLSASEARLTLRYPLDEDRHDSLSRLMLEEAASGGMFLIKHLVG